MAKSRKTKTLAKKAMKKTKGGVLIGLSQPTLSVSPKVIGEDSLKTTAGIIGEDGLNFKKL